MLTEIDTRNLTVRLKEVFVTKEDFYSLEARLEKRFDKMQNSIDGLIKLINEKIIEDVSMKYRMGRAEEWIDKAAPKIGISFDR
jgi:hypothetical protein